MLKVAATIALLLAWEPCVDAFVPPLLPSAFRTDAVVASFSPRRSSSQLQMTSSGDSNSGSGSGSSRIEGNQREPTSEELAVMDEMITKLANAKPYELPNAVRRAFRVCSSPQFFMRIAARSDSATDESEKEKLSALASNLVATLDAVVSTTEEQLDERAKEVQNILTAASEPDSGEFLVPLLPERIQAMQEKIQQLDPSLLDEGFLSTVDSWANKAHQDGMDGMVGILQKVLQMVAGIQVSRARALQEIDKESEEATLFETLLKTDTDSWDALLQERLNEANVSAAELKNEVQRTMESVVLALDNGSMQQRVMAEYLRELVSRIEALGKTADSSSGS